MPFAEDPIFLPPDGGEATIWRCMDFTKFVSLLDTGSLFFSRADRLSDPFEGSLSQAAVHSAHSRLQRNMRQWVVVNCWHMNEHESAAMWKLYLKSSEGAAVRSTYSRLKSVAARAGEAIHIGRVVYIDYATERMDNNLLLGPFLYKRKSFEHEHELRAVIRRPSVGHNLPEEFRPKHLSDVGLPVRVDLSELVESVYVCPDAEGWFRDLVASIVRKYGHNFDVRQSTLAGDPVF